MDEARAFITQFPLKRFAKGQTLIYQDGPVDSIYAIRSGFIKIHDASLTGDEQLIWIAKKYDFVPLERIYSDVKISQYYYTAFTDVEAYTVDKDEFLAFTENRPTVMPLIVQAIADQYNDAMRLVNALQKPRAREKLVYTLSFIASRFAGSAAWGGHTVAVPLTQQALANLSGMTRETAAVELKKLKDEGCITYGKTSLRINIGKLEALL